MNKVTNRQKAHQLGHRSEMIAAWFLRLKGYKIMARRFKTKVGEVDIIARKRDLIIMVEVKARPSLKEAMDAISTSAMVRIENAGDVWLCQQHDFAKLSVRYDMIAVMPYQWPIHVPRIFDGGR
jgi:putative endonuclease